MNDWGGWGAWAKTIEFFVGPQVYGFFARVHLDAQRKTARGAPPAHAPASQSGSRNGYGPASDVGRLLFRPRTRRQRRTSSI
jgi:hypothetical protein